MTPQINGDLSKLIELIGTTQIESSKNICFFANPLNILGDRSKYPSTTSPSMCEEMEHRGGVCT
jgi:hypothetical protein